MYAYIYHTHAIYSFTISLRPSQHHTQNFNHFKHHTTPHLIPYSIEHLYYHILTYNILNTHPRPHYKNDAPITSSRAPQSLLPFHIHTHILSHHYCIYINYTVHLSNFPHHFIKIIK
ncbi:hypothetical protein V8G54_034012 [Vigna mungo]|uniref:Uncharacterized protein n=1 Tax=Vigna mungo TaxID=3915 RepID=A0AAQ3MQE0_VIGMU